MLNPSNETELSEALAGTQEPLRIVGGGTRPLGNPVTGELLSTSGLCGISLYEPEALTIVAGAGTPLKEVEAALLSENQRLPFEPMDHRPALGTAGEPTIGGVVAANVSGPRRIQAGACRDSLIGVRFVDGRGTILKNGGRVMKNVTGYDLVKLLAGSFGTLGVISEVSFKVLPRPAATAVVLINGLSIADAVSAMSKALCSPFEVSGAAHAPCGIDGHPVTMVRVEGFEASVEYRAARLRDLLSGFGECSIEIDPERTDAGWKWVRDAALFAAGDEDLWRISIKPTDAPKVAAALPQARLLLDWGGGLVWAGVLPGTDVRSAISGVHGHGTVVRAVPETLERYRAFHPEPAPVAAISEGLRREFDPRGILNPGLMG